MSQGNRDGASPAKVAAVQFEPVLFRKAENTASLLRLVAEAGRAVGPGGLVVLPEMATTGYVFRSREEIAPYVEPIPGPTTRVFGRLAREARVAVVVGLPEVDPATGAFYNSAALIGPDGEVAGIYRKTHSFHCDTLWSAEGNLGLPVFDGPWPGPLGIVICMDAGFFETARVMALSGTRVLAFPTNWLRAAPSPEWRARAAENGIYLVAADRWGEERGVCFAGGSCVIGPHGDILAEKDRGDGVVVAEVDPGGEAGADTVRGAGHGFGGRVRRRPELYHDLLRHPYLWPERFNFGRLGSGRFWLGAAADWGGFPLPPGKLEEEEEAADGCVFVLPPLPYGTGLDAALAMAARERVYLGFAVPPREEVVLVGPAGLVGRYASPHVGASPGDSTEAGRETFPVFDLPFARVGLLHPLDLLVPEAPRILAKKGADVILVSGSWPEDLDRPPGGLRFLWAERAETNDVWLAAATGGAPAVFGPSGTAAPERPGTLGALQTLVETGPGTSSRRKDRIRRLRPELYLPLVGPGERWSPSVKPRAR